MKITKTKIAKSLVMDGGPISIDELKKDIVKAEKGPFYTPEQSKKILASWRREKDSQ